MWKQYLQNICVISKIACCQQFNCIFLVLIFYKAWELETKVQFFHYTVLFCSKFTINACSKCSLVPHNMKNTLKYFEHLMWEIVKHTSEFSEGNFQIYSIYHWKNPVEASTVGKAPDLTRVTRLATRSLLVLSSGVYCITMFYAVLIACFAILIYCPPLHEVPSFLPDLLLHKPISCVPKSFYSHFWDH